MKAKPFKIRVDYDCGTPYYNVVGLTSRSTNSDIHKARKLMEAAPCLREALEAMLKDFEGISGGTDSIDVAREALAMCPEVT